MRPAVGTALLLVAFASPAASQAQSRWTATVMAGPSTYDLAGVGTAFALGAHFGWQPFPALVVEPGLAYFRYSPQVSEHVSYVIPELSVQAIAPWGPVRPYVGGGAGVAFLTNGLQSDVRVMLHGAGGLRARLSDRWGARGELRLRTYASFGGHMADFTFGLTRRF